MCKSWKASLITGVAKQQTMKSVSSLNYSQTCNTYTSSAAIRQGRSLPKPESRNACVLFYSCVLHTRSSAFCVLRLLAKVEGGRILKPKIGVARYEVIYVYLVGIVPISIPPPHQGEEDVMKLVYPVLIQGKLRLGSLGIPIYR